MELGTAITIGIVIVLIGGCELSFWKFNRKVNDIHHSVAKKKA